MTVSEARASLPDVLDRVTAGEEVTITRHGKPVAVVVRPDALLVRRADQALSVAETVRTLLQEGRRSPLAERPTLSEQRAAELLGAVRASRSSR
jgi:antitoxin (DNA-binding transcriptional repressor) of toxin-antitoxin stability system